MKDLVEKLDRWREDLPCLPVTITKNELYADSVVAFSSHRAELLRLSGVIAVVEYSKPDDWNQILDRLDHEEAAVNFPSVLTVEHRYGQNPGWALCDRFSLKVIALGLSNYPGVDELSIAFTKAEIESDVAAGALKEGEALESRSATSKSIYRNARFSLSNLLAAVVKGLRESEPASSGQGKKRGRKRKQAADAVDAEIIRLLNTGDYRGKPRELAAAAGAITKDGDPDVERVDKLRKRLNKQDERRKQR